MDLSNLLDGFEKGIERFQRNFKPNRISKHAGAKTRSKDYRKNKKIRRKMAKASRKINRRKR